VTSSLSAGILPLPELGAEMNSVTRVIRSLEVEPEGCIIITRLDSKTRQTYLEIRSRIRVELSNHNR